MFIGPKKFSKKRKPSISDFNKYLINTLENKQPPDKINNSFVLSSNNILKSIKPFNNPNKKLLLEKLDISNFNKTHRANQKSFCKINTINYDNSEDLLMAQKLSSSIMTERNFHNSYIYYPKKKNHRCKTNIYDLENNLFNNNTKEKTNNSTFDNDIIEASPLELYNRKMEFLSNIVKIQSFWRGYTVWKKIKLYKFFSLIENICEKNDIYYMKLFFMKLASSKLIDDKIYYKKYPEKNIIKKCIKFHIIKSNRNKKPKTNKKAKEISIKGKTFSKNIKVIKSKNWWMKLPLILEKYIKKKTLNLYCPLFLESLKIKAKENLKEKRNNLLCKLINLNDMKNMKKFMNIYKEKTSAHKQKQKIYYSLIKSKSRINKKPKIFDFQSFYKKNILEDLIKKYKYTSVIQKYYRLWKKECKDNNKNKKKRIIKIKKVKKNLENLNDLNILKEDTFNNVSEISNNISIYSNNTLNSIQSINGAKICLTTTNKKMRIKKISVDPNYYKYVGTNKNYNNI